MAQPHSLPLDMNMGEGGDTAEAIGEYKVAMVITSQNSSELLSISSCPPSSTETEWSVLGDGGGC